MPAPATETGPADRTQVLVIGGGFAGLCAAIQAARDGAQTTLLDAAPAHLRGGNARHCRNIRLAHLDETPWQRDTYPVAEFTADMARMGTPDAALAAVLAEGARDLGPWLAELGVAFEPWADGNLPYSRRTAFFRGGGQALVNALTRAAQRAGVEIRHEWHVTALPCPTQTGPLRVAADTPDGHRTIQAAALVLACGGYGGDRDRLSETLGPRGAGIANRGTPHQRGAPLHWLLENGAAAAGQPGDGHLVAVDARAPLDDAGIVSRVDGMQLGIVVDATGHRFMDEGETATPARYSTWGRALAARPDPRAWLVLGADTLRHLPPMLYPPIRADGAAALALQSGIDAAGLAATLAQVNAHLSGGPPPDPPRSRWDKAPLAPLTGPLAAIPMQPGLAFTRHGLAVDAGARVQLTNGAPAPRLFAAGTAMCGAVLGQGYLSGTALTIAGVFGRIAGENAARQAREAPAAPIKCRTAAAPRPVAPPP
ncbi:FAD-dependent tricarballylate dehydrogenase TcuA, partial [Rhodovulum adriaticum]